MSATKELFLCVMVVSEDEIAAQIEILTAERQNIKPAIESNDIEQLSPRARTALRIVSAASTPPGNCMVCGCTDADCQGCIDVLGMPCSWVNEDHTLCNACL